MDRSSLIAQLAFLKQELASNGESIEKLVAHFQAELDRDEVAYITENDRVVAFCDWSWIVEMSELPMVYEGKQTSGDILVVINIVSLRSGLVMELRHKLPPHRWIIGMHDGKLHAPKGVPHAQETVA